MRGVLVFISRNIRKKYNKRVADIAQLMSMHLGDTPLGRSSQAHWIKLIRKDFPLSEYGFKWGREEIHYDT